ncbi:MAG: hypothetical protein JJE39_15245, partial [Vicinamibacteria bacterium]|nr:hypothetical protein [Vicinamibacteria bacterium]
SEVPFVRENARRNLLRLDALAIVDGAQARVDRYQSEHGAAPTAWKSLIVAGLIGAPPRDPLGVELTLLDGRVLVSKASPLWRPGLQGEGVR